ncbi:unnamed protein product, partial [Rotaria sp. Silwood2]
VYVRRSYISYDLNSIQHRFLSDGTCAVQFSLYLPLNHPNRLFEHENMARASSFADDLTNLNNTDSDLFQRMGILAAFDSWERAKSSFDELLTPFSPTYSDDLSSFTESRSVRAYGRQSSCDSPLIRTQNNRIDEAVNLIYVFIKDDANLRQNLKLEDVFLDFVQSKREVCKAKNIRRITFSLAAKRQFPVYYTYRKRLNFKGDKIYRNLEPALAYQLEVYRLRSFDLEFVPTSNHKTHIYLGKGKVHNKQHDAVDHRFFARSIIRHSDFITKE